MPSTNALAISLHIRVVMTEDTKHFLYKVLVTVQITALVIATALVALSFIS